MVYYRLRDIRTPPFAYVLNKTEALHACRHCELPSTEFSCPLEVEICMAHEVNRAKDGTGSGNGQWEAQLRGFPLMADHWMIGDEWCAAALDSLFPDAFENIPVSVVSWLARDFDAQASSPDMLKVRRPSSPQHYTYFRPKHQLSIARVIMEQFPAMECQSCGREIPNLPIDHQPVPESSPGRHMVASLRGLYLDGYDYLFHESVLPSIEANFPAMILERLPGI